MLLLLFFLNLNAQSSLENVLDEVAKNNKTILMNAKYWDAQNQTYKSGIAPSDPNFAYDYMVGSPVSAGNQTDITLTQSFDFPTTYIKKKQIANQKIAQSEFHLLSTRQDILLEAKKICIELVFRNKLDKQNSLVKRNTELLLKSYESKLKNGNGNILDVNKIKLQLLDINKQTQENNSFMELLYQKLIALNGGKEIVFADSLYPLLTGMPEFNTLEQEYENADPLIKILEQEKIIAQKQLELSKSMWLPKMEAGFHHQGLLGQKYNGVRAGISIPIWENKNTVQVQKSKIIFTEFELDDHRNQHYFEVKQLYEKYTNLKNIMEEYNQIFETSNSAALLMKALELGQISTIEYFMETNYLNNALNNYLQIEMQYHESIADLYKYKL